MTPFLDTRTLASGRPRLLRLAAAAAMAVSLASCVAGDTGSSLSDKNPPTISLSPGSSSDSAITFNVGATDNLGLLHVDAVAAAPGIGAVCDTTFSAAVTSFTRICSVSIPSSVPIGTTITILAQSVDGQHNISRVDTLLMATGGGTPALVILTAPKNVPPDTAVVGFSTFLSISGRTQSKVKVLGWQVTGVFAAPFRDSIVYGSPLKDSVAQDSSISFVGASTGTAVVTPFMYDSLGRLYVGPTVNVIVVSSGGSNTIPVVDFGMTKRIETTDTIHVSAKDLAGVRWLGYKVTTMPPANTFVASESLLVAGAVTSAATTFNLKLPIAVFPTLVRVMAFATNANGRQDSARVPVGTTGFVRFDTITVVGGLTKPLPNGGVVADGIYHPNTNRIYLSNIERNTLEVFDLGDSTFHAPIQVGSRPWGVAARPLNRAGAMTDTILVANSGGTLISKVCVAACVLPAAPHEVQPRYALPNIIVYSVTSKRDANGVLTEFRKAHDFSDRPQYLAATCTGAFACGDVIVAYTTTPTAGQTVPFTNQGTIRYENLTKKASHFFFEQSIGVSESSTDTLEIDRFAAQGIGSDSVLVPFLQGPFITGTDTSFFSVVVRVPLLAFRDTTFTRNSGNFAQAVFGEGGRVGGSSGVPNARGMTYNVTTGMITSFSSKGHVYNTGSVPAFVPVFDGGVSAPVDVSDFIANTSTSISGVAINFDGATSAFRADSTFLVDDRLRLQGLLQTTGGNAGLDFHPANVGVPGGGASGPGQTMFTASSAAQVEVYNTNFFNLCLTIPTRDPIIGPIKAAPLVSGDIILVGATKFGVVIVTITPAQMAACT
jgi:hypothetical protein